MRQSGVASSWDLHGCTEREVQAIEEKYDLRLPRVYRQYLLTMGHKSGRLFTIDHVAVFYPDVLSMTEDVPSDWDRYDMDVPKDFFLPPGHLIINSRLGDQFEFIICNDIDDSSVYYFNTDDWKIELHHQSISDWLKSWCTQSESAIASGYFLKYPNGTTP